MDRLNNAVPGQCLWEPSLNQEYIYIVAILGYHGPCAIMIGCYFHVLIQMRKKINLVSNKIGVHPSGRLQLISDQNNAGQSLGAGMSNQPDAYSTTSGNLTQGQITRERRVFITLTYILVGYLVCWLPFHVVFDVMAVDPAYVPTPVLTLSYWLAYGNSTINPILYNFSSPKFRRAFKKILCGRGSASSIEPTTVFTASSFH